MNHQVKTGKHFSYLANTYILTRTDEQRSQKMAPRYHYRGQQNKGWIENVSLSGAMFHLLSERRWGVGKTNTFLVAVEFSAHYCMCHFLDKSKNKVHYD